MNLLDLISGAGNLLDLPGSSVRDLLSGRNPFDQWTTPFSSDNRASGRDMLSPILGANKETGMSGWLSDPMEGLKDIAGFGAEVITDPMNLIPAGWFGKVLGSRKATQAANAAVKAERGGKYSFVNPKLLTRTADDAAKPVVQAVSDQNPMKLLGYTPPPETVYHGGWDWSASATPEHPYGMFDVSKMHTGEGITVRGPGGYVADEVATTKRYKAMAQGRMDDQFYASPDAMENYFKVGDTLPPQTTNGVPSEVVNFEKQGDRWAVAERDKAWSDQAGDFVSDPRAPLRWHSTRPDMKLLKQKLGENPMQSKTYTLDMPAGSKEKFMGWEDNVVGQPQAVQGLLAADPKLKGVVENVNKLSEARSTLDSLLQAERGFLEEVKQSAGLYSTEDAWHALTQKGAGNARGAHWSLNNQESVAKFADIRSRALGARAEYEALREKLTGEMGLRPGTLNGQDPSNSIRGENLFEMLTGRSAADAGFEDVAALRDSGIPGMRSLANSTGKSSHNYAVWDTDLINQMRVRAIDGQRVPINPTTLVQRVEQPFQRAAVADSQLMSNMNPMNLQRPQTAANPVALALLQNLLSRSNNWAGGNQ